MLNRPLPAPSRDFAILVGRVILGVVLFAHGWQKLVINGISGTYGQFEKLGIPLAIVSASFASFVEFVGGALIVVGALTTTVVALDLVVMVGAAGFVHVTHGIFAQDGGWELVGVIVAAELALAAFGPGRFSVDHLVARHRAREQAELHRRSQRPVRRTTTTSDAFTPAVQIPTVGYPSGAFAAVGPIERPASVAARAEGWYAATGAYPAGSPDATPTGELPVTAAPAASASSTGAFSTVPAEAFAANSPSTTATGAFAAPASSATPAGAFAAASPSATFSGALAATSPSAAPTAGLPSAAAAYQGGFNPAALASPAGGLFAVAPAATATTTDSEPTATTADGADTATAEPAVRNAASAAPQLSPPMASAGVHRAMSERAGRSSVDEPAPFGVTVQSPLDFTPTAAFPVVSSCQVTEMIAVAATPGALPRRIQHTDDLPRASAVRPYA